MSGCCRLGAFGGSELMFSTLIGVDGNRLRNYLRCKVRGLMEVRSFF